MPHNYSRLAFVLFLFSVNVCLTLRSPQLAPAPHLPPSGPQGKAACQCQPVVITHQSHVNLDHPQRILTTSKGFCPSPMPFGHPLSTPKDFGHLQCPLVNLDHPKGFWPSPLPSGHLLTSLKGLWLTLMPSGRSLTTTNEPHDNPKPQRSSASPCPSESSDNVNGAAG